MISVSVLMPVFNAADYLVAALESVLAQTYRDFEVIAVDDGSSDRSAQLLDDFSSCDKRVKVIRQSNHGCAAALNRAIGQAQGRFWIRMDADDISVPDRFGTLVNAMECDYRVDILGSGMVVINGHHRKWAPAFLDHDRIFASLIFGNFTFAHATMIMRASALRRALPLYRDEVRYAAQDYEVWCRLGTSLRFANINMPLYLRRWHDRCVTVSTRKDGSSPATKVTYDLLGRIGLSPNGREIEVHNVLSGFHSDDTSNVTLEEVVEWMNKIGKANRESRLFNETALLDVCQFVWQRFLSSRLWSGTWPIRPLFAGQRCHPFRLVGWAQRLQYCRSAGAHIVRRLKERMQ